MRRYLLDAGPLTALLRGRIGAVALMKPWVQSGEATTSILAYGEAVEYLRSKPNYPAHLQTRPREQLIGDVDVLIAATALERRHTVVTIDGGLARVPGLRVLHLTKQQLR
jgi:hypothetical protein